MLRSLVFVFVVCAGVFLTLHLYLYMAQKSFIFFPSPLAPSDLNRAKALGFQEFMNEDAELTGWARISEQSQTALVVFHGNASRALQQIDWVLPPLEAFPVDFLLLEYPGYSNLPGSPSMSSIDRLSQSAIQSYLSQYPDRRLILIGESLGGGPASTIARNFQEHVEALVLISSFTSLADLARVHYPFVIGASRILRHNFDNLEQLAGLQVPLVLIHGTEDRVIPYSMSERLYEAYSGPKDLVRIDKAGHSMEHLRYDSSSKFWLAILQIVERSLDR